MDRAYAADAIATPPSPPASPSIGYPTDGNPGTGTPATEPGAYFFHMLVESIRNVIVAAAITPDRTVLTQLLAAIRALVLGGTAQSWQDLTASRAVNTAYTNTTGRPILVSAGCTPSGATGFYSLQVGGVDAASANSDAGSAFCLFAIVPAGAVYTFSKGGGDTTTLMKWRELR